MAPSNTQGGGDRAPIVKGRSNQSIIWKFCKKIQDEEGYVTCDLCDLKISQGGKTSNWGTSGFRNHMKKKHSDVWKNALDEKIEQERQNNKKHTDNTVSNYFKTLCINTGNNDTLNTNQAFSTHTFIQPTLTDMFETKKIWDIRSQKAMQMHKLIGEYIALNFLSFNSVESPGFKHFISNLQPQYNVPGRRFFSQKVMPSIYHSLKRKVQDVVNAAKFISITTDEWTSRYSQDSFQSFTAHCISESG